jgi:hypothetical protein
MLSQFYVDILLTKTPDLAYYTQVGMGGNVKVDVKSWAMWGYYAGLPQWIMIEYNSAVGNFTNWVQWNSLKLNRSTPEDHTAILSGNRWVIRYWDYYALISGLWIANSTASAVDNSLSSARDYPTSSAVTGRPWNSSGSYISKFCLSTSLAAIICAESCPH